MCQMCDHADYADDTKTLELPDAIRIPLHALQADWKWLMARFATEPDMRPALTQAVEDRLSQLETALYEHFSATKICPGCGCRKGQEHHPKYPSTRATCDATAERWLETK